ncbi:hypothetical protein RIF29_17801 [Crotalaria pallida]|uniref:Peptidase A1 domain-containing protein n=1 Tax=Crotalaria pallida TaxID=3830 RepID=A0AAN9FHS3_CROPI
MAIDTVLLLFLLTLPTISTSSPTTPPSHFHDFNVEETIAGTKILTPSQTPKQPDHYSHDDTRNLENGKWKAKLLHRDKIISTTSSSSFHEYRTRFIARMKRDVKRATSLIRRINNNNTGYYSSKVEDAFGFGSEVVSGTDEGSGEYFVRIGLGSPPTYQYMVIDSGSDIVWVQCQPCNQCYNQSDPLFDPANSTSYIGVSCAEAVCDYLDNAGCHEGRCGYEVSYGDGSFTQGTLALETVTFGRTVVRDTAIGCGHWNQGMFVGAAGLLGLGGGPMSFVGQLGGQTGGAFGYCLVSRGGTESSFGSLEFGRDAMPVGAAWVPLIKNPMFSSFYYVGLSGLGVGGSRVPVSEDYFRITDIGDGGVVMDTGTAVTRLPTVVYNAFRDAFIAQTTNLPRASGVSIFDTCYDLKGFVSVRVPTVSFYFVGGPILTLPAKNYLIPADEVGTFCFAFAPSPSRLSIIGNIQQEGIQVSIDVANGFVGFGPNVC